MDEKIRKKVREMGFDPEQAEEMPLEKALQKIIGDFEEAKSLGYSRDKRGMILIEGRVYCRSVGMAENRESVERKMEETCQTHYVARDVGIFCDGYYSFTRLSTEGIRVISIAELCEHDDEHDEMGDNDCGVFEIGLPYLGKGKFEADEHSIETQGIVAPTVSSDPYSGRLVGALGSRIYLRCMEREKCGNPTALYIPRIIPSTTQREE